MVPTNAAAELRRQIEDGSLPPAEFTHRAHLSLAHGYLTEEPDFALAAFRFRAAFRRYAVSVGAEAKYHETMTWAYLALLREAMDDHPDHTVDALLADHPELVDHRSGALTTIYDVPALTADPRARRIFVLPRSRSR